jgi:type VI secretion system protein ImpD
MPETALASRVSAPPSGAAELDFSDSPALAGLFGVRASPAKVRTDLGRLVLSLDARLAAQLNEIIEAPAFARLEAAWRGVLSVVTEAENAAGVKVRMLDLSWDALSDDLNLASDPRRTALQRLIGQRELDTLGGEPFGLIMVEHALTASVETSYDEFFTARLLADLGEAVACPFVLGVADDFFGETDAGWLTDRRRIGAILASEDYAGWRALRAAPSARFLGLVLPRIQLRGRYHDHDLGFRFHQKQSESAGLWGNGASLFIRSVIGEFRRSAWFGFLKLVGDTPGIGAVPGPDCSPIPRCAAPTPIARARLNREIAGFYAEEGFIPIAESPTSNALYFVGNRSVMACNGDARLEVLTQLQSVLIACRLIHYVKVQLRALIGQVKTAQECELTLNNWIEQYVSNLAEATPDILARYPLKAARVQVRAAAVGSARFRVEILLKPQYQIDHVTGDISLMNDVGHDARVA